MKIKSLPITRQAIYFIFIVCAMLIVMNIWQIWHAQRLRLSEASIDTANLARSLSQHADDALKLADTVLVGMVERQEASNNDRTHLERMHQLLMIRAAELPLLQRLTILDRNGNLLVTSQQIVPTNINNADREYFTFHRDHTDRGPHVGPPIKAKSSGTWIITVSRRFNYADGSFAGVVLASINMDYFNRYYESFDIGRFGAISLVSENGVLITRRPFNELLIGRDFKNGQVFRQIPPKAKTGNVLVRSSIDNIERQNSFHRLQNYPLILITALSTEESLAEWKINAYQQMMSALIIVTIISFLGTRLVRQINLCAESEQELLRTQHNLKTLNEELEHVALSDSLTGLANRRHFDTLLENEYSRAKRYAQPLSVIMIDVDFFKQFNDIYGHPAGDDCLRKIGIAIKSQMKRPSDIAARYGGEEFTACLGSTDSTGAKIVAENIQKAIYELQIPHSGSLFQFVTISCGIYTATLTKASTSSPANLISAADIALYAAKAGGRNFIVCTESDRTEPN